MALTLEQIRANFKKEDTKESRPNNYYRFWDMKAGEQCVVRFLPDLNADNPFGFMVEKLMHKLTINGEDKTVPCLKMYDEECAICNVSSAYYKEEGKDSPNGKKYWRKKQHIVQALIMEDPLAPNPETGSNSEGKVMFLNLSYQIYSVIKASFESGDLEQVPYFHDGGYDFIIKKTQNGDYPKYDVGTNFVRRASSLTPDEIAIADDGSVDLSTLLPSNPGVNRIESMLDAALTGGVYEDSNSSNSASTPATEPTESSRPTDPDPVQETIAAAEAQTAAAATEYTAESADVLSQIRNRKTKAAE